MFADPQTVTIDAVPITLNRLNTSDSGARYASSDGAHRLVVSHQNGRRNRRQIKLSKDTLVANPLIAGQNVSQSISVYTVVDLPVGYDVAAAKKVVDGHVAYLSASSGAAVTKLLGGES